MDEYAGTLGQEAVSTYGVSLASFDIEMMRLLIANKCAVTISGYSALTPAKDRWE